MTITTTAPAISSEQLALAQRILAGELQVEPRIPRDLVPSDPTMSETLDVHALIAVAQASMGVKPVEKPGQVEAADPNAISALVALAAEHKRQADFHTAQRDAITAALSAMIVAAEDSVGESIDALTVHKAPVFTYKPQLTRTLNQKAVKQAFPDIPENAAFYSESVSRRAVYK